MNLAAAIFCAVFSGIMVGDKSYGFATFFALMCIVNCATLIAGAA